jgi:Icc-related predicted phosphoesterase
MKNITFISDTHTKHDELNNDLIGGDFLIHSGDIMSSGYNKLEIIDFLDWFSNLDNYEYKIFIAGNHDRFIQNNFEEFLKILSQYEHKNVIYLQDESVVLYDIKFYGTPWQPWFWNWSFNMPRGGKELREKFEKIPSDTDILITHTPPKNILDYVPRSHENVGCEILSEITYKINPIINVFGHIHEGYGNKKVDETEYINASILNERYQYVNKPINITYDELTKKIQYNN